MFFLNGHFYVIQIFNYNSIVSLPIVKSKGRKFHSWVCVEHWPKAHFLRYILPYLVNECLPDTFQRATTWKVRIANAAYNARKFT